MIDLIIKNMEYLKLKSKNMNSQTASVFDCAYVMLTSR